MLSPESFKRRLAMKSAAAYGSRRELKMLALFAGLLAFCLAVWLLRPAPKPVKPSGTGVPAGAGVQSTAAEPAKPVERVVAFDGKLDNLTDGIPLAQDGAYDYLLRFVARTPPEDFTHRLRTDIAYDALVARPQEFRGNFMRVGGIYNFATVRRLEHAVGEIQDIYRVYLYNTTDGGGYIVDMLEKPPESLIWRRDYVEITGVFLRNVTFENDRGKILTSPFFFGRRIEKIGDIMVSRSELSGFWMSAWMALVLGLVIIGGYLLLRRATGREGHGWKMVRSLHRPHGKPAVPEAATPGASPGAATAPTVAPDPTATVPPPAPAA
ncbi:MAG: hypothetical protein HZA54_10305, partial [Planctomycetes bacterium]|nr:hypothetical protein [Planctomycetota bacterium]